MRQALAAQEKPWRVVRGGETRAQSVANCLAATDAALAASIFHYGEIPIPVLKRELRARNIPVRL